MAPNLHRKRALPNGESDDDPPKRTKIDDLKWTFDDGDVLIRFPDLILSFQVFSQILGLASPVFKRMFKKEGFMEGTMLKNRSGDKVVPLDLPEDSPRGMLVFCMILHHQYKGEPDLELLEDLGVLCEKYICTDPFKNHVRYWLDLVDLSTPYFPDRVQIATRLLVLFYHFGIENMFREASSIILFCEEDVVGSSDLKPEIPFPDEIPVMLNQQRTQALQILGKRLGTLRMTKPISERCDSAVTRATGRQKTMFDLLEDLYNIASEVESDDFAGEMREIDEEVRRILGKGLSLESVRLAIEHSRLSSTQLDTGRDDPLLS